MDQFINKSEKNEILKLYHRIRGIYTIIPGLYSSNVVFDNKCDSEGNYYLSLYDDAVGRDKTEICWHYKYKDIQSIKNLLWIEILRKDLSLLQNEEDIEKIKNILYTIVG